MAILLNPLGEIRGRVGNCVFSKRNGKIYVSRRPRKTTLPTERETAWRNKFKIATTVSAAINRNSFLKSLWPKNAPYNHMVKENIKNTDLNSSDYCPIIIPGNGFIVEDYKINISGNEIELTAGPLKQAGINKKVEKWVIATGIIIYIDPYDEHDKELVAIEVKSGPMAINLSQPIKLSTVLYGENASHDKLYKSAIVILALITLRDDGTSVKYSMQMKWKK